MVEIIISIIFLAFVVFFLNPFMLWMPSTVIYMLVGGLIFVFVIFAGLVWREKGRDEREKLHKMIAGRIGYLVGVGVLVVGIAVQTITSHPDPWLVSALAAMVIAKLFGLLYGRIKQ